MAHLHLLGVLLLLPLACVPQKVSNRIVGGQDAQAQSWPWQASIGQPGYHNCGGTLISDRWVVSAAHCFPKPINSSLYVVRLGVYQLSNVSNINTIITGVKQVIVNSKYDYTVVTSSGDIALLELQTRVAYSSFIRPVCLPAATTQFQPGMNCWVTGWGNVQYLASLPPPQTLQEVQVPLIDSTYCNSMFLQYLNQSQFLTLIQSDMLCAGYTAGQKSFCNGDSGGPLVCSVNGTWLLTGVVSWGPKVCASPLAPGVYTRVTSYVNWIKDVVSVLDCSAANTISSAGLAPAGPNSTALTSGVNSSSTIYRETNATNAPVSGKVTVGTSSITAGLLATANSTFRSNTPFVPNTTIAVTSKGVTQYTSNVTSTVVSNVTTPLNTNSSTRPLSLNTPSIPLASTSRFILPNFTAPTILNSTSNPTSSLILKVSTATDAYLTQTSGLDISTTDKKISSMTTVPNNFTSTHSFSVLSTPITTNSLAISNSNFNTNASKNTTSTTSFSNSTPISVFASNANVTSAGQVSSAHFTATVSTSSFNVSTTSTPTVANTKELNSTGVVSFTHLNTSTLVLIPTSNLTRNISSATNLSLTTSDLVKIIKATVHQVWSQILQSLQNTNIWAEEDGLLV